MHHGLLLSICEFFLGWISVN